MFRYAPLTRVILFADTFRIGIPIGTEGIVSEIDPRPLIACQYLVSFPSLRKEWWLPECDLRTEEEAIADRANEVISEALIDFALATRNKVLFESHTVFKEW